MSSNLCDFLYQSSMCFKYQILKKLILNQRMPVSKTYGLIQRDFARVLHHNMSVSLCVGTPPQTVRFSVTIHIVWLCLYHILHNRGFSLNIVYALIFLRLKIYLTHLGENQRNNTSHGRSLAELYEASSINPVRRQIFIE